MSYDSRETLANLRKLRDAWGARDRSYPCGDLWNDLDAILDAADGIENDWQLTTGEPLAAWQCPECGAWTRARMADHETSIGGDQPDAAAEIERLKASGGLVEKVAQAIYAENFGGDDDGRVWQSHAGPQTREHYRRLAAAAVQVVQDQLAAQWATLRDDQQTGALYVGLVEPRPGIVTRTVSLSDSVNVDYSKDGFPVGVEILYSPVSSETIV